MSGALAPIRKLTDKTRNKFKSKLVPENKVTEEWNRLETQAAPTLLGPIASTTDEDQAKVLDPYDVFGQNQEIAEKNASDEEARRIAALPPPRPIPDEEELARVRRQQAARGRARKGRASTILSDSSYGSETLG